MDNAAAEGPRFQNMPRFQAAESQVRENMAAQRENLKRLEAGESP